MNRMVLAAVAAIAGAGSAGAFDGEVNFLVVEGKVRPELHSSGFGPRLTGRDASKGADVKSMHFMYARTHDWALVNAGQRVCDTHFIFPLMKLDPKDPSNYYFKPTDEILRRTREMGLKVYYRLGTSIEHTGDVFYNAAIPEDYEKYAEVLAGIIRHYTKGWADGFNWDIRYWEIWNEPDGIDNMWRAAGPDGLDRGKMSDRFAKFFAVVLKRLKGEFPDLKIGGPAMCECNLPYFGKIFRECKAAGVSPDFVSWHYYGFNPDELLAMPGRVRKFCDEHGLKDTELIINEWHYLPYSSAWSDYAGAPDQRARIWKGPAGQNGIDSAVFTLAVITGFHRTPLDQSFYYGCGANAWGYLNADGTYNKNYYALRMIGKLVDECGEFVQTSAAKPGLSLFGARAKSGADRWLLVNDYRGNVRTLEIGLSGLDDGMVLKEALVLGDSEDLVPADASVIDGRLRLVKGDVNSAAFLVRFGK